MSNQTGKEITSLENYDEYHDTDYLPAPCQRGCPVGTDIPSYAGLIAQERVEEAFEVIRANNPFGTICGRVCAMPCESQCRRGESDGAVSIRNLKRFVTDVMGEGGHLPPVPVTRSETVAIVGGGPAGLTAAQDLAEAGHEVHIYEKANSLGGMMRYGIPLFRLPRHFVEWDIDRILKHCPGIEVHLNRALGEQVSLEELKAKHDVVLLSVGLWQDRLLGIPGEEPGLEGLHGIDFLTDINEGKPISLTGKVVVAGGGNVAIDVARTALRAGAKEVELYCLEKREEMPAWAHEVKEALAEGITINPSWGPKRILHEDGRVTGIEFMRCTSVFDADGRFSPTYDPKITRIVETGTVLTAIGLSARNSELEGLGLLERGRIKAEFETMRTPDPKVFAAGDGAFGPSAIVYAIHHGHRAAHYIKAFLDGQREPAPYRVPYATRAVPPIQDPRWETLAREEQRPASSSAVADSLGSEPRENRSRPESLKSHGTRLTENGAREEGPAGVMAGSFPLESECELTYDWDTAKRQAARCLRCDTETGMSDYSRRTREHIHAMARTEPGDITRLGEILRARLKPRDNPFPPERPAQLDDLVFLPAALTRLVIDPYREHCSTATPLGKSLSLEQPYVFTGFDEAPDEIRSALALALKNSGCCYLGFRSLDEEAVALAAGEDSAAAAIREKNGRVPWLQLIMPGRDEPVLEADGLVYVMGGQFRPLSATRRREGQLLGLSVAAPALAEAIPYALENGFDLLLLDGTPGVELPRAELGGAPDLTPMRDALRILRELGREEEIDLLYFGGLRSGTDVAKVLAVNCKAGVFGAAMAIAMGGVVEEGHLSFANGLSVEERGKAAENWIKGSAQETAIIARCTGKTNVHNLEPEDMRTITLATALATSIPLASGRPPREYF